MSKDLIFGFTKKDWSRKPPEIVHECGPESCMITYKKEPLTADEKAKLDKLAQLKMKAASGDRKSQKQWKKLYIKILALKAKAKKGDPRARHTVEILEDSGLFGSVQKISGEEEGDEGRKVLEALARKGDIKSLLKLKRSGRKKPWRFMAQIQTSWRRHATAGPVKAKPSPEPGGSSSATRRSRPTCRAASPWWKARAATPATAAGTTTAATKDSSQGNTRTRDRFPGSPTREPPPTSPPATPRNPRSCAASTARSRGSTSTG